MGHNSGQIIKSKSTERYTVIDNQIIKSKDLSLEEKGFLTYLLHKPSDWVFYRANLFNSLPDSKGTINRLWKALQAKGYIVSVKVHGVNGRFQGWNSVIYDIPVYNQGKDLPSCTNAELGQSGAILNTNSLIPNTNTLKTKEEDIILKALFNSKVSSNKAIRSKLKDI